MKTEVCGHEFQFSLTVVEALSPYRFIFGQADLFHFAKVSFEEYKKQFTLEFRKLN